jgi:nucleoside-diphosphate-sugar epimerase
MITVFITGATGFIGQSVMSELLRSLGPEDRVYALVRKPVAFGDRRVVTVTADLKSLEPIVPQLQEADFIIHVAGEARMCGGVAHVALNVAATERLLALARTGGRLQRFIYVSSIAAMDRAPADRCKEPLTLASTCSPRTTYGRSKLMAEEAVVRSGVPYTIFRPGFVYGAGMRNDSHLRRFARLMGKGVPLHRLGFPGRISLIHVADLAGAIARCLFSHGGGDRVYLAGAETLPLGEALSLVGESLFGCRSKQFRLPALAGLLGVIHSKIPVIVAGMFLDYYWMDDPDFRIECFGRRQQRLLRDNVGCITADLVRRHV